MNPHDDAISLQHAINARAAFPESRGLQLADRFCKWITDGPNRVECAIGSAFGSAILLYLFGRAMGGR